MAFSPTVLGPAAMFEEHGPTSYLGGKIDGIKWVFDQENPSRASLVAQWLRICLLMQGTRVRALVWEDPTCHGAAGPVSHNY